jgi:hypothetical protein
LFCCRIEISSDGWLFLDSSINPSAAGFSASTSFSYLQTFLFCDLEQDRGVFPPEFSLKLLRQQLLRENIVESRPAL